MTAEDPLARITRAAAKSAADKVLADVIPLMTRQAAEKAARSVVANMPTERDYQAGIERGLRLYLARSTGPVSPHIAGRMAISAPTASTIAAARAAGVVFDPAAAAWVEAQTDKRAAYMARLSDNETIGKSGQRAALREARRLLTDKAKRRGIRIPAVFGSDADAVQWLRARMSAHVDGGDAA